MRGSNRFRTASKEPKSETNKTKVKSMKSQNTNQAGPRAGTNRMAVLAVLVTALASLSTLAVVAATPAVTLDRFTVPFTIPGVFQANGTPCVDLPPGVTSISGVAEFFQRTITRVDSSGVTHLNMDATAFGAAIDNNGVVYSFNYANHFSMDVPPGEFPQQIRMTDHFNLNGEGKANQMHVGFVIVGTIDGPGDVFPFDTETINIRGDAFNCDPI